MADATERTPTRVCPECGLGLPPGADRLGCPTCGLRLALLPGPEPAANPPPGGRSRFFGNYEILGEIARGGMGLVYRARQLGLNRVVALKTIQSHHLLSDEARLRFRVEIEAVAQLHHPHIVSLYESGEHDGAHYFTMRLVEGGDLAADLQRERSLPDRIRLLVKVCRAVHYAHQRGILHRDLKPSNILVDPQGEPHVADFGLAKSVDQDSGFTFTASVLGSPSYMSPEQAAGRTHQLTTAVDVYGLGAVLYHVLTGRPPFQAATPIATLRQVVDQDPAPPRAVRPGVDPDLATIALKCLRKRPAERYGTAEELARDLERWLAGQPILARPLGPLATVWHWSRRHPVVSLLGAALALALAGLVIGTGVATVRIRAAEHRAAEHLGNALISEVRAQRLRGDLDQRAEGLRLVRQAATLNPAPEFRRRARSELLALLVDSDLSFVAALPESAPADPAHSLLDPTGARLAVVTSGTNVAIHAVPGGDVLLRIRLAAGAVTRLDRFSPDGRFLALETADRATVYEVASGRACWTRPGTNLVFAFGPGAAWMMVQETPNEAVFVELPSGGVLRRWQAAPGRPGGRHPGWSILAPSPDGRLVAGNSEPSRIVEWMDVETGRATRLLTNGASATAMGWSHDGSRLAVAARDGRTYLWDRSGDGPPRVSPDLSHPAHALAVHPGGRLLALAGGDERLRILELESARVVFETPAHADQLGYSPDGRRLGPLLIDDQWGWLEMRPSPGYSQFDAGVPPQRQLQCRFSPDGRLLLVGTPAHVALCDPAGSGVLRPLPTWRMSTLVFHPREHFALTANTPGLLRFEHRDTLKGMFSATNYVVLDPARRWRALEFTPDGRWLAAFNAQSNAVFVFDHTLTNRVAEFGPHTEAETLAISPDGRWVATGSYDDRSVRLWDVSKRAEVFSRRVGLRPQAAFSGDGRWLVTFGDTFALHQTGSWQPAPPLPFPEGRPALGAAAFSLDGRFLAVVANLGAIHLFDLHPFTSLGILRPADPLALRALAFSPDGARLAAVDAEGRVAIWHLRDLRRRLAEYGLDWAGPTTPPDPVLAPPAPP